MRLGVIQNFFLLFPNGCGVTSAVRDRVFVFASANRLFEQQAVSNKLLSDRSTLALAPAGAAISKVNILFVGLQKLHVAHTHGNCLKEQDCFQHTLFIGSELIRVQKAVRVHNHSHIIVQVVMASSVEEIPKHINGEQIGIIQRPIFPDEPFERLGVIVVILDKVKHAASVRFKRDRHLF